MRRQHAQRQGRGVRRTATAVVAAALAVGAAGCSGGTTQGGSGTTGATVAPSATGSSDPGGTVTGPGPSSTPAGKQLTGIPVYWIGQSAGAARLYREFRTVPDAGGRVASAIAAMTRMKPLDPDYTTPWAPANRVRVTQRGQALTVDLSADALAKHDIGGDVAAQAVQQLVYTATAASATPVRTVTITVDGKPADAWGAVRLGTPQTRRPPVEVLSHAWVTAPQEGDRRPPGKVQFSAYGTSFEATFGWTVTDDSGKVVANGFATGGDGIGGFGSFAFEATLTPGVYTVELRTDDPSDGEGPGPMRDTKRFTVR